MNKSFKFSGFSMVEMMIAVGLASGVALTVMKITEMSSTAQKQTEIKDEIHQLYGEVTGILADRLACKNTLSHILEKVEIEKIKQSKTAFEIKEITELKDKENSTTYLLPIKRHGANLIKIEVKNLNLEHKSIDLNLTFKFRREQSELVRHKLIRILLEIENDKITSCVSSTGHLSIDPKEACDYLLGLDSEGLSYFTNAECDFPRAVCEKQNKKWESGKCLFSEDEILQVRKEVCLSLLGKTELLDQYFVNGFCQIQKFNCDSLGWDYNEGVGKCEPNESFKQEVDKFEKLLKGMQNPN